MPLLQRVKIAIARRRMISLKVKGDVNPLEGWIHGKVRAELKRSREYREAIVRTDLDNVTREDLKAYQIHRFRQQLGYVMENSYHYWNMLQAAGVRPHNVRTWEDQDSVPVTDPAELAAEPLTFLCVSQSKVIRVFTTSGTSGTKKRLFHTQDDVLNIVDSISSALRSVVMTGQDTLQIMFPAVSVWDPGLMLDGACKVAGLRSKVCG